MINWLGRRPQFDATNVVGNIVLGDVHGNLVQQFFQGAPPDEPTLPWRDLPTEFDPFRFLSWGTRLVPLVGRDGTLNSLQQWAERDGGVKVRFLTGAGGTGKSRLAAELAASLRDKNWSAGFAVMKEQAILPVPKEGLLWIADYPEENRAATQNLLGALARMEKQASPIRLLLLSRRSADWWQVNVDAAHAADICDAQATKVTSLDENDTVALYRLTYERVVEHLRMSGSKVDETAIRSWWAKQPALHGLPLFAMAAAMHGAVEGNASPTIEGGIIVQSLVRRERLRMNNLGQKNGFANSGLSRIIGLAAIPGRLLADDMRHFADPHLELGIPARERIIDTLDAVPWWEDHSLPGLTPDVLAAELLLQILSDRPDRAAAWLRAAIERSSPQWVIRIERLAYDIKRVRGPEENRISQWLAEIGDMPDAAIDALQAVVLEPSHSATLPLAVHVAKILAGNVQLDDEDRARWLHNGSIILASAGDAKGALEMVEKEVEINHALVASRGEEFDLNLASSLDNLSNRLDEAGRHEEAVTASIGAIGILQKAVAADLASDENAARLANALNNCSGHLNAVGKRAEAIEAIEGSVQLHRRLAKSGQRNLEPEFAMALHNLAQLLPNEQDAAALVLAEEAIEILERLTAENPMRFEPELAGTLRTLSTLRSKAGDDTGALEAARRAVTIRERLIIEQPGRFDSDLAIAYEALSQRLNEQDQSAVAINTMKKALAIWRRLIRENADRYRPDLARCLDHLTAQVRENETAQALVINTEAVDLWRQLATQHPKRYKPDLARSLNNLSNLRSAVGDKDGGLAAAREAYEILLPIAQADPRFNYELASMLMTLHRRLMDMENATWLAMMAVSDAVDILRNLAKKNPASYDIQLFRALREFLQLLIATGDGRQDAVAQEATETLERVVPREQSKAPTSGGTG